MFIFVYILKICHFNLPLGTIKTQITLMNTSKLGPRIPVKVDDWMGGGCVLVQTFLCNVSTFSHHLF